MGISFLITSGSGMTKKTKLTDEDWGRVYKIRIRSKRGEQIPPEELELCMAAMKEDRRRYKKLSDDVFDATVPFGSSARAKRK